LGDVFANAERVSGAQTGSPIEWNPSEFNLVELKQKHARLGELVKKRNELEKQLGIRIT